MSEVREEGVSEEGADAGVNGVPNIIFAQMMSSKG